MNLNYPCQFDAWVVVDDRNNVQTFMRGDVEVPAFFFTKKWAQTSVSRESTKDEPLHVVLVQFTATAPSAAIMVDQLAECMR